MSNPISKNIKTGTVGELLVQIRLLQYGVQAAPPLKDSGNDLIAVKNESFKSIQVKTTNIGRLHWSNLPDYYHVLALVDLLGEGDNILLDQSQVYLVPQDNVKDIKLNNGSLDKYLISKDLVRDIFD